MKVAKYLTLLLVMLSFNLPSLMALDDSPVNIGLTRFEAISIDQGIRVEWDTDTELGTVGYMLKRGQDGSFTFITNPDGSELFIGNEGGPDQGYNYSYTDESTTLGKTYTYKLFEVASDGSRNEQAEAAGKAGLDPTETPIGLPGTGGGGGSSSATNTPVPTIQPTSTERPQNTPVPNPTSQATQQPPTITPRVNDATSPTSTTAAVEQLSTTVPPIGDSPPPSDGDQNTDADTETNEGDLGLAVAFAQGETENNESPYPGSDLPQQESGESTIATEGTQPSDFSSGSSVTNDDQPTVIGQTQNGFENQNHPQSIQDDNGEVPQEGKLGRVYLWIGFIAALVIFTAAVFGAILLYTRRRYSDQTSNDKNTP